MSGNQYTPPATRKPFELRAVAFLDILGFKSLVCDSEKNGAHRLERLVALLNDYIHFDPSRSPGVPANIKPNYLFISDSIVLSAPIMGGPYDGLSIVQMKCIEVAQKLLYDGYILRGAIDVGSVWHTATNIIGSAYITAYQTEEDQIDPRIVLCPGAQAHWDNVSSTLLGWPNGLCTKDVDDATIVDLFHPEYSPPTYGDLTSIYRQYKAHIFQNLANDGLPENARSKWRRAAETFNRAIIRHNIGAVSSLAL